MSCICASFKIFGMGVASGRNAGLELCGHWPQLLGQFGGRVSSQVLVQQSCCVPFPIVSPLSGAQNRSLYPWIARFLIKDTAAYVPVTCCVSGRFCIGETL